MKPSIVVDNVSKKYRLGALLHETMLREAVLNLFKNPLSRLKREENSILALKNVNFKVDVGEVVGIIGRNGAGKSTLLKVLSKITYPSEGTIKVRGRVASLIEVGTGFHDELTGRENIYLNGSILGMRKREINERLDAIIEFAGVEKFVDTPIKRYSSGMRLRLGFAVAAHMDPDVLFVDEVLAVGDADFQKKCLNAMDDMRSGGRTVLFVSHNMAAIENLCPRTIWIDNGEIRMDGETTAVISAYLSTFSASQRTGYDLTDVGGRGGNGAARYTRIEFIDEAGAPVSLMRFGRPLHVRLSYRANETIRDPHFVFRIFSEMGTLISTISTWHTGYSIPEIREGDGEISLQIPKLNLIPSRYYISLWLSSAGGNYYDVLDHCIAIDVEASKVETSSGRGLSSRWGVIHMDATWDHKGQQSAEGRSVAE